MNPLLNPWFVVSVFVAGAAGFSLAPLLLPTAPVAARAVRIAAWSLVVGQGVMLVLPFVGSVVYRVPQLGELFRALPALGAAGFWLALAFAAVKLLESAPARQGDQR